jgi:hypothetical protein
MFFAKSDSSVVTFSAPADETNYNAIDGAGTINVGFNVSGGIIAWRDALYIFGENNIAKISGNNSTDFRADPVTDNLGSISGYSLQEVNGDIMYMSADGFRTLAGTDKSGDVDLTNLSRVIGRDINSIISYRNGGNFDSVVIRGKTQYRFFYNKADDTIAQSRGILAGMRLNSSGNITWEWTNFVGRKIWSVDGGFNSTTGAEVIIQVNYDSTDGFVYTHDVGIAFTNKDNTLTAIPAQMQLSHMQLDDPRLRKTYYRLCAYLELEGNQTIDARLILDLNSGGVIQPDAVSFGSLLGPSFYDLSYAYDDGNIFDGEGTLQVCTQTVGSGTFVSILIYTTGGASYSVRSLNFEYILNGRR